MNLSTFESMLAYSFDYKLGNETTAKLTKTEEKLFWPWKRILSREGSDRYGNRKIHRG